MDRKRLVHQLDTPYSTVQWPLIQQDDQDAILELLCTLLSPLGAYRRTFIPPSKGKRSKRKRRGEADPASAPQGKPPPRPELAQFVDVGLANITKCLQDEAGAPVVTRPGLGPAPAPNPTEQGPPAPAGPDLRPRSSYAAIFVSRSGQASAFHCHFPQMVAVAGELRRPGQPGIRLVGFSNAASEGRLSECLGIPRASCIALRAGAPLSQALLAFVMEKVSPIEVSWLKEVEVGHRETKINTIQTTVGPKKQRCT